MPVELTEKSTHEDIQQAVDDIVEARKGEEEKAAEEKGDGQKLAEERDKPTGDMTADSGKAEAGSGDTAHEGEEETGDSEDRAWLDDDLRAEVAAYGIDEKELADFTSRDEVERALRFFDRSAMEAGRKAMAEEPKPDSAGRLHDKAGRFTKKEEPESPPKQRETTEGTFEANFGDIWDEEIKVELEREFTRMRDHYESKLSSMEERLAEAEFRFAEMDTAMEAERFDNFIDSLECADFFGKTGKETPKELERRQDVLTQVKIQQAGMMSYGRDVDLSEGLVRRMARAVHPDYFTKKELKARTRKIAKQSDGRMGGGTTRPNDLKETPREFARRRYKELEDAG